MFFTSFRLLDTIFFSGWTRNVYPDYSCLIVAVLYVTSVTCDILFVIPHPAVNFNAIPHPTCQNEQASLPLFKYFLSCVPPLTFLSSCILHLNSIFTFFLHPAKHMLHPLKLKLYNTYTWMHTNCTYYPPIYYNSTQQLFVIAGFLFQFVETF